MEIKAVLTTEYLPPISSFWLINRASTVHIECCENYQKKSTRNRAKILGVNGVDLLSVPLKSGKNSKMPISKVEVSYDTEWIANHLHAIKSAYGNAPYFEYYYDDIERILKSKYNLLVDLNSKLTSFFIKSLDIDADLVTTSDYLKEYPKNVIDTRKMGFNKRQIKDFIAKPYNQVFEDKHDFAEDLSILDLLMCKGPEGILYL